MLDGAGDNLLETTLLSDALIAALITAHVAALELVAAHTTA
jgi:hypothetical protein